MHLTGKGTVGMMLSAKYISTDIGEIVSMRLAPNYYSGMHRGVIRDDGVPLTGVFIDEELSRL